MTEFEKDVKELYKAREALARVRAGFAARHDLVEVWEPGSHRLQEAKYEFMMAVPAAVRFGWVSHEDGVGHEFLCPRGVKDMLMDHFYDDEGELRPEFAHLK